MITVRDKDVHDLNDFRLETRDWLENHCPQSMRTPVVEEKEKYCGGRRSSYYSDDQRAWVESMISKGWVAPTWPCEYGGGGLSKEQEQVLKEELSAIKARSPIFSSMGLSMIGPAILEFGSEKLKREHLPKMIRGEIRWCQGYSEPNSGSDLAGLQTRAEDFGDHFIVNGQKVWTSSADKSDWMFCLVRTDFESGKHYGISLVLFDMESTGVTVRPIKLISGASPFCETYLDNVKVEKNQVVGEINKGWTIAKYLLTHERQNIGDIGNVARRQTLSEEAVDSLGLRDGQLSDSGLRTEIAEWEIDYECHQLTMERVNLEIKSSGVGNTSAMLKYYGTELNKRRHELEMSIHGGTALGWGEDSIARPWLRSKGNSIEGGTSEIQLNIISKRILGLG